MPWWSKGKDDDDRSLKKSSCWLSSLPEPSCCLSRLPFLAWRSSLTRRLTLNFFHSSFSLSQPSPSLSLFRPPLPKSLDAFRSSCTSSSQGVLCSYKERESRKHSLITAASICA